jgi:hypothetical protein
MSKLLWNYEVWNVPAKDDSDKLFKMPFKQTVHFILSMNYDTEIQIKKSFSFMLLDYFDWKCINKKLKTFVSLDQL